MLRRRRRRTGGAVTSRPPCQESPRAWNTQPGNAQPAGRWSSRCGGTRSVNARREVVVSREHSKSVVVGEVGARVRVAVARFLYGLSILQESHATAARATPPYRHVHTFCLRTPCPSVRYTEI